MLRKDVTYGTIGRGDKGETEKARLRREREGWFSIYAPSHLPGIDIGCGANPIYETFFKWDIIYGDGDATYMDGVPDEQYSTVFASHLLEHLQDPVTAVRNWWRILKPGGYLIINVPHRDLYEKKKELPSRWNSDHKWFWLPATENPPYTLSLAHVMGAGTGAKTIFVRVLDEGYSSNGDNHPSGEFSIEGIVQKVKGM